MSAEKWMKYVNWPACSDCEGKGFVTKSPTSFPEECARCKTSRENAVKNAQSYRRRALKSGEILDD